MERKASTERITLAHGAGGRKTRELIKQVFARHFKNPEFTADDAAILPLGGKKAAFTTDGFIVSPWQYPGGNIGKLSICGTVNDLSCMGARPRYLSCAIQIEEGCPMADLETIAASMEQTAKEAGVRIVAGDTKVAGRGQVDHVFITTTGIGEVLPDAHPAGNRAAAGDAVIVTGDIGRHGCAILLARKDFDIKAEVTSDCAPLWGLVASLFETVDALPHAARGDLHVLRDATRGGVGTVLYEIAEESGVGIRLQESGIPVQPAVKGVCGMLGLNPLYLACEGRLVVFAPKALAPALTAALRQTTYGKEAAVIGEVTAENAGRVVVETEIGTETMLPEPTGELLPRIC
ncbi:MAG: hydrogenase expression/formation protein HypE [Selenomonadaceae bacterium]|nr:hydrogenase expression/formation protein HypE [Selenomonadaceae bacterium]